MMWLHVYAHVSFSKTLNGCLLYLVSDKTAHRTVNTVAGCLVYVFHIRSKVLRKIFVLEKDEA